MQTYTYVFLNKTCRFCHKDLIERFWKHDAHAAIERSGAHCPECLLSYHARMHEDESWFDRVRHILLSQPLFIGRELRDEELVKLHGVESHWFHIGRTVYADSPLIQDTNTRMFVREHWDLQDKRLVYLPNNYLGRLYFFVPNDAVIEKDPS